MPQINLAQRIPVATPEWANATNIAIDFDKLLDNDEQELVAVKRLAKSGDQLAIDVLCNLAVPDQAKSAGIKADVAKRASDLLAELYASETTQPAVRHKVGETAMAWAKNASDAGSALQMYGGVVLVAGHHCAQFDQYPALQEKIERLNNNLVHIKEEGDNIYRPDRAIQKGELDAAVTLLNQPEPSVDITHALHVSCTAHIDSGHQAPKESQLQTAIDEARHEAAGKGASMFGLPILHQGHYTLAIGSAERADERLAFFDSKQAENTPDWVENIRDEVIYLGGAFQHDDDGKYTHEACGSFCLNGLRYMKQLFQEQLMKAQNPFIEAEQIPQSPSAEQMVCAYVDHLSSLHAEDIEAAMRAERFNMLLGPLSLAEEEGSFAAVKERQALAAQQFAPRYV